MTHSRVMLSIPASTNVYMFTLSYLGKLEYEVGILSSKCVYLIVIRSSTMSLNTTTLNPLALILVRVGKIYPICESSEPIKG